MKFAKTRQVKSPSRGTSQSAGIDMFLPELTGEFEKELMTINERGFYVLHGSLVILPGTIMRIPLGIVFNFSECEPSMLFADNRSGYGSKGLITLAKVIDQDYQGEVFASVKNLSDEAIVLTPDKAIIQLLHIPVFLSDLHEQDLNNIWHTETERGEGCLNSTNR